MGVRFLDFELDTKQFELRHRGERVPMEPQVFDVLVLLVERRDRVVTKNELLDEVWGTRFVTESALTSRIKSLRKALGDTGRDQRIVKTMYGRGYRFVADVLEADGSPSTEPAPVSPVPAAGPIEAAIAAVAAGAHGLAVEVIGPAGSGKTEALEHAADLAARAGLTVARGTAADLDPLPYRTVAHAVDELLRRRPNVRNVVPVPVWHEIERFVGGELPTTRQRLLVAMRDVVVAAAAEGGVVMLLDDLHLAGTEALALVDELARLARRHPFVLVAAHQPARRLGPNFNVVTLDAPEHVQRERAAGLHVPPHLADDLTRIALAGPVVDLDTVRAATGREDETVHTLLDSALRAGVLERDDGGGYRFTDPLVASELVAALPPARLARDRTEVAARLAARDAAPASVATLLIAAERPVEAAPYALAAARLAARAQLHHEVLRWTDAAALHLDRSAEAERLALRADALADTADHAAIAAYRDAIAIAAPEQAVRLRARLARTAILAGDLHTARDALSGLAPTGGPADGMILFARGMLDYFEGDLDAAEAAADAARDIALAPGAPNQLLDVISLQGLIAHTRGEWFDRLRRELRSTAGSAELVTTVFDSHLCVAEYLLYGPTPYEEVIELARDLRAQAERIGARRAVAFAVTVMGEAALLAGDLDTARRELAEAAEIHRETGGDTGTAHALQRLAELELAAGNRAEAERLLRRALTLARWSPLGHHLLQRIYGTLIAAAPDSDAAMAVVEEASEQLNGPSSCLFCHVMIVVPAAIACAEAGRLDEARGFLAQAERSASLWQGTAWQGAVAEATAHLARAEGDEARANRLLDEAAALFDAAGQPLDVARCVDARSD